MRRLFVFLVVLLPIKAWCQLPDEKSRQYDFVMYLIGNGLKDDALTLGEQLIDDGDTISFLKGYISYSAKKLNSAVGSFSQVKSNSPFFVESNFWNSLSHAHLGKYDGAERILYAMSSLDDQSNNLRAFELAGISLLRRDIHTFDSIIMTVDTADYRLVVEAQDMLHLRTAIVSHKNKQPWVAAFLSALLPGMGKVYAGNIGEGISAFLLTGSLMGVTAENWYREGLLNWKTILFGTAAAVFYVGNIYGSAVTVKVARNKFNHDTDVQILYNIHIPIRNSFRH